jgi:hypothetical protein
MEHSLFAEALCPTVAQLKKETDGRPTDKVRHAGRPRSRALPVTH